MFPGSPGGRATWEDGHRSTFNLDRWGSAALGDLRLKTPPAHGTQIQIDSPIRVLGVAGDQTPLWNVLVV